MIAVSRARVVCVCLLLASTGCLTPNYLYDFDARNADQTIHVVIENPAGSREKWEVRSDGRLIQEFADGEPIAMPSLPWPVNGGMIPRTLLSYDLGGDGEPIDVLLLGERVARGEIVRAVPVGLLEIVDHLERDDKIIAVRSDSPHGKISDIAELEAAFPGVRDQIASWYEHSRAGAAFQVRDFRGRASALILIGEASLAFERADATGTMPEWVTP